MQVIIDEIVSNVRATDKEAPLPAETVRKIVDACLRAVDEKLAHAERVKEEQSVDGAWSLQPRGDR
jgi:hypothetical protein